MDTDSEKAKSYLLELREHVEAVVHLILKGNIKKQMIKTKKGIITFSQPIQRYRGYIRKFEMLNSFL